MSQGIRRSKKRKDGSLHYWYRFPVTDLWNGEYCPLCLLKNEANDCHHIVSRSETLDTIGYEQHWHNNIINICIMCHEKFNRELSDSVLILKRLYYYVDAVHGLRTWKNRGVLKTVCNEALQIKNDRKKKFSEFEWDWGYAFLSHVHMIDEALKYTATAHYRASFCEDYIEKVNSAETPYMFLSEHEIGAFHNPLPAGDC